MHVDSAQLPRNLPGPAYHLQVGFLPHAPCIYCATEPSWERWGIAKTQNHLVLGLTREGCSCHARRVNQSGAITCNRKDDKAAVSFYPWQGKTSSGGFLDSGIAESWPAQLSGWIGMRADSNSLFSSPLHVIAGPHTSRVPIPNPHPLFLLGNREHRMCGSALRCYSGEPMKGGH